MLVVTHGDEGVKEVTSVGEKYIPDVKRVDDVTYQKLMTSGVARDMELFGYAFNRTRSAAYCSGSVGCC